MRSFSGFFCYQRKDVDRAHSSIGGVWVSQKFTDDQCERLKAQHHQIGHIGIDNSGCGTSVKIVGRFSSATQLRQAVLWVNTLVRNEIGHRPMLEYKIPSYQETSKALVVRH